MRAIVKGKQRAAASYRGVRRRRPRRSYDARVPSQGPRLGVHLPLGGRHPAVRHATFILETPGMTEGYNAVNLQRARTLLAGAEPEPLPPAAFQLQRGRTQGAAPPDNAAA